MAKEEEDAVEEEATWGDLEAPLLQAAAKGAVRSAEGKVWEEA